jgi:hypothetical protein
VSLDAMDWVWEKSKAKGVARMLLLALADKAIPDPTDCKAYGSLSFLQKRANCTREAVTDALSALYALGELEQVPGEKGPYGAAVYRLPLAVGHVRPGKDERVPIGRLTRPIDSENQSAHPTDPGPTAAEIGRLTRPGVVGSPDRFEAQSVGSPDHTTSSSPEEPPPPAPAPSPGPSSATTGGGGINEQTNRARMLLMSLPAPWTCGPKDAARIAPQLAQTAARLGWPIDDHLGTAICTNPGGINNYPAVIAKDRIPNLLPYAAIHGPRSSIPPACTACLDQNPAAARNPRFRTHNGNANGQPCPTCHPDHAAPAAA